MIKENKPLGSTFVAKEGDYCREKKSGAIYKCLASHTITPGLHLLRDQWEIVDVTPRPPPKTRKVYVIVTSSGGQVSFFSFESLQAFRKVLRRIKSWVTHTVIATFEHEYMEGEYIENV